MEKKKKGLLPTGKNVDGIERKREKGDHEGRQAFETVNFSSS